MRALRTGKDHVRGGRRSGGRRRQAHFEALVSHELDTGTSMFSAAPIPPEQRCGTNGERMQQHTDLAWLQGFATLPLALLAQRAGAATAHAGRIHDTQAAIGFSTPLVSFQHLPCWAAKRPIGLERKVLPSEATCFPGSGSGGWAVARGRRGRD